MIVWIAVQDKQRHRAVVSVATHLMFDKAVNETRGCQTESLTFKSGENVKNYIKSCIKKKLALEVSCEPNVASH